MSYEPIEKLIDRCLSVSANQAMVFFVGSGVSIAFPSFLPSAAEMIAETVKIVAPPPTPGRERNLAREIRRLAAALPEIYYEILRDVAGNAAIGAWEVLRFWKEHPKLKKHNLGPNSGHLLLVYLSWRGRVPIITTNFDTLLEEAAEILGLTPVVCVPGPPESSIHDQEDFQTATHDSEVAIWKVHGTVEPRHLDSLHTTLRTISRADWKKLDRIREQFEQKDATVCFIGYSGSDMDLFPYMPGWPLSNKIHWLGPSFSQNHAIHQNPARFVPIVGTSDALAASVITRLRDNNTVSESLKRNFTLQSVARQQARPQMKNDYLDAIRDHLRRVLIPLLPEGDARRLLVHSRALTSIGENRRGWPYATRFISTIAETSPDSVKPEFVCGALTLKASLGHELSQYVESQIFAEQARQLARRHGLRAIEVEAVMAFDEALRMQHLPGLKFREKSYLLHPQAWKVVFRFIVHALVFGATRWRDLAARLGQDTVHAESMYLEHLVRAGAMLQGFLVGYRLRFIAKAIMTPWWHRIEECSYRIGYAHGVANARKYADRLHIQPKTTAVLQTDRLYDLLSARTGRAIAYRDEGERLAELGQAEDAVRAYRRAYRAAIVAGNTSLALKALIGRKRAQRDFRPNRRIVEGMLSRIQGAAYRRIEADLLDWLCGDTPGGSSH